LLFPASSFQPLLCQFPASVRIVFQQRCKLKTGSWKTEAETEAGNWKLENATGVQALETGSRRLQSGNLEQNWKRETEAEKWKTGAGKWKLETGKRKYPGKETGVLRAVGPGKKLETWSWELERDKGIQTRETQS